MVVQVDGAAWHGAWVRIKLGLYGAMQGSVASCAAAQGRLNHVTQCEGMGGV